MTRPLKNDQFLSIGDLAERTGLSVLRIRAWERRYQVPNAGRTASGHRRYPLEEALRLESIAQAVKKGHRIGELVHLQWQELRALLDTAQVVQESNLPGPAAMILEQVRQGHEKSLRTWLDRSWKWFDTGSEWVDAVALPWITALGEAWNSGDLGVAEEHFGTGILQSFIEEKWRSQSRKNHGQAWVLTLLSGDWHSVGLHLCALAITQNGGQVLWLGQNTPMVSVVGAVRGWKSNHLCVSVSSTCPWSEVKPQLQFLKENIPDQVRIVVGGAGYSNKLPGLESYTSLKAFWNQLQSEANLPKS